MGDREHRRVLKKCDIDRDKVSMCIKRVATITSLKSGITEEDTLRGFGSKLVLSRSKNMDKTNTTKDTRGKAEERFGLEKEWNEGFYHVRQMTA